MGRAFQAEGKVPVASSERAVCSDRQVVGSRPAPVAHRPCPGLCQAFREEDLPADCSVVVMFVFTLGIGSLFLQLAPCDRQLAPVSLSRGWVDLGEWKGKFSLIFGWGQLVQTWPLGWGRSKIRPY